MHNGVISITRQDPARDKLCMTWSERTWISQDTRSLFQLDDQEEEHISNRWDSLPARMNWNIDDVKKITARLKRFDVFRLYSSDSIEEDGDTDHKTITSIPIVSLASRDSAPIDVVTDLMTAEERGKQKVIEFVKQ